MIEAGVLPAEIDVFNCHATSTPKGDASEAKCVKSILAADVLGKAKTLDEFRRLSPEEISTLAESFVRNNEYRSPLITALKGNLGHCVTAAGALESAFALLTLQAQEATPIRNLEEPLCRELRFAR